jgi:hypothetical protein
VGKLIDCTSYFELEQAEYAAKGITLSVEAWLVKLMVRGSDHRVQCSTARELCSPILTGICHHHHGGLCSPILVGIFIISMLEQADTQQAL